MVFSSETFMDIQENASKDIKDTLGIKDKTTLKDIAHASNTVGNSGGLSVREQGIMGILRAGGEFGIRDITANLPEYSEKMIQRDLLALVLSGKVKKTGLKRWSRYSIA